MPCPFPKLVVLHLIVLSSDPERQKRPWGQITTDVTPPLCPFSVMRWRAFPPGCRSQTLSAWQANANERQRMRLSMYHVCFGVPLSICSPSKSGQLHPTRHNCTSLQLMACPQTKEFSNHRDTVSLL